MEKIAPLTSRSLLRLSGADTIGFLQNLITCDVDHLQPGQATFGALLTPQGKILFDFFVLRDADTIMLDVNDAQCDELMKRLTFYKLRANVVIERDKRQVYARWGGSSAEGFADPRVAALGRRFYADALECNATEADWHAHRIEIGVPQSGLDFDAASLFPHDASMDQFETGGVDFTKGCYVGQEVVSRMHHRSTARNRFVHVTTQASPLANAGSPLTAAGRTVGTMGSSAGSHGLALVRVDRVGKALETGEPITLDAQTVHLARPAFATFDFPS